MGADRFPARTVALPLVIRDIEDDLERSRSSGDPYFQLELVAVAAATDHPLVAGKGNTLRPRPFGRFGLYLVTQRHRRQLPRVGRSRLGLVPPVTLKPDEG